MSAGKSIRRPRRPPAAATDGPGISHGDIADHNLRAVLGQLWNDGPLSRRDLSERLGLTDTAITGILRRLETDGLVRDRRRERGNRYSATEFEIVPGGAVALGLRLLPSRAELLLLDLAGEVLSERRDIRPFEVEAAVAATMLEAGSSRCLGIGVVTAPTLPFPLESLRAILAPLPVITAPDTAAAVTAERLRGHGERENSLVALILGEDGVRAGLSIGGRPFTGRHGLAGGIGAMRTGRDRAPLSDRVRMPPALVDDAWAEETASHLLDAAIAISGLLAPGILVIGGDLPIEAADRVIAAMERERRDTARRPMASPWMPPIVSSRLTGGGIVLGAALLPFLEFLLPNPRAARQAASGS